MLSCVRLAVVLAAIVSGTSSAQALSIPGATPERASLMHRVQASDASLGQAYADAANCAALMRLAKTNELKRLASTEDPQEREESQKLRVVNTKAAAHFFGKAVGIARRLDVGEEQVKANVRDRMEAIRGELQDDENRLYSNAQPCLQTHFADVQAELAGKSKGELKLAYSDALSCAAAMEIFRRSVEGSAQPGSAGDRKAVRALDDTSKNNVRMFLIGAQEVAARLGVAGDRFLKDYRDTLQTVSRTARDDGRGYQKLAVSCTQKIHSIERAADGLGAAKGKP